MAFSRRRAFGRLRGGVSHLALVVQQSFTCLRVRRVVSPCSSCGCSSLSVDFLKTIDGDNHRCVPTPSSLNRAQQMQARNLLTPALISLPLHPYVEPFSLIHLSVSRTLSSATLTLLPTCLPSCLSCLLPCLSPFISYSILPAPQNQFLSILWLFSSTSSEGGIGTVSSSSLQRQLFHEASARLCSDGCLFIRTVSSRVLNTPLCPATIATQHSHSRE